MKDKLEYLSVGRNSKSGLVTLKVSDGIHDVYTSQFKELFGVDFLKADFESTTVVTDEGVTHRNVHVYSFISSEDDFDTWWDAAKQVYREGIAKSIGHTNN